MQYTRELGQKICEHIACGLSVLKACKEEGWTERSFFRELIKNETLRQEYARAREARAHAHAEEIETYKEKLMAGEIDAQTAAKLFDMTRWQAGHEMAKVYGEKLDVTGIPAAQTNIMLPVRERIRQLKQARAGIADLPGGAGGAEGASDANGGAA